MSFRAYIFFMLLATVLAWIGWLVVLLNVNPKESGLSGFVLFYLTLFVSLIGILALVGIFSRVKILKRHDLLIREVKVSFRHAVLLSVVAVASLIFSAHGWLKWWVLLLFIAIVALIEYVALVIQKSHRG